MNLDHYDTIELYNEFFQGWNINYFHAVPLWLLNELIDFLRQKGIFISMNCSPAVGLAAILGNRHTFLNVCEYPPLRMPSYDTVYSLVDTLIGIDNIELDSEAPEDPVLDPEAPEDPVLDLEALEDPILDLEAPEDPILDPEALEDSVLDSEAHEHPLPDLDVLEPPVLEAPYVPDLYVLDLHVPEGRIHKGLVSELCVVPDSDLPRLSAFDFDVLDDPIPDSDMLEPPVPKAYTAPKSPIVLSLDRPKAPVPKAPSGIRIFVLEAPTPVLDLCTYEYSMFKVLISKCSFLRLYWPKVFDFG
jgi:hypothetical protein